MSPCAQNSPCCTCKIFLMNIWHLQILPAIYKLGRYIHRLMEAIEETPVSQRFFLLLAVGLGTQI